MIVVRHILLLALAFILQTTWVDSIKVWSIKPDLLIMTLSFIALRTHMPMNLHRRDLKGKGRAPGVDADIARVCEIWRDCRARWGAGGDFLFGAFSAADAMFAPVATRLDTYGIDLDETCGAYSRAVLSVPAFIEWREAALKEPWFVPEDEID